jgi:DNA invertase Pin-like site-specific DNA recombinase
MNAALYHRVSTLDQDPTLARDQLRTAAAARGMTVVLDVEETGSGANNDRPGLRQIMNAATAGKVSAVLVYKLDRFGRSALDLLANIRALNDAGCRFIAVTQGIDIGAGGDPMSRLMLTILAAVAEFERELIRERTRLGLRKAAEQGRKGGRPRVAVDLVRARALFNASDGSSSWSSVARALGVNRETLRKALKADDERLLQKGVEKSAPKVAENGG